MTMLPSETSNIAWFKLAECVTRKEKERALTILRLLVHSFNDPAFAAQLEGDILRAFSDEKAGESYRRAQQLYEQSATDSAVVALKNITSLCLEYQQPSP